MTEKKGKIAIVPGSFDPITEGHIDIIRRAAERFDHVYVAVMINQAKQYRFSIEQRTRIAQGAVKGMERVSVISSEGMLWMLAKELGASAIVKGYRNEADWKYEQEMAQYNKAHYPQAETILLKAEEHLSQVSSTVVREKLLNNEDLSELLPKGAIREIEKIIK
ncbi:MAG: pantetheine-phosphate adenylyltransferase [Ruminococcaceae bacterium]|nr:pantetheine-phosphate adenylyltransferase [Oscillospiraceae bacterium]